MSEVNVTLESGAICEVTYEVFGSHIPATRIDPEEFPEIEVKKIYLDDEYYRLDEFSNKGQECINEAIYTQEQENVINEQECQADYMYEMQREEKLLEKEYDK